MARQRHKKFYNYECTITGESYKMTAEAPNPDELVSVRAFYEMNPEKDDRPETMKAKLGLNEELMTASDSDESEEESSDSTDQ